jgi:dTDP-glucose 4,6-dehydratase
MNCLITGERGFVGQNLVPYLEGLGWQVNQGDPDIIINLASISDVEQSIREPTRVITNNVNCMLEAIEKARERKIPFIQFSTVEVYESANPYAASKSAQESIATAYHKTYGIPVIITTTNNIVGKGQKGKFIPTLIGQITKGEEVSIYTNNGEMGYRTYNPVLNIVDALAFIINRPIQPFTRYHLGGGQELSNLEMAQKIARLLHKPLKYKLVEASEVRPGYTRHLKSDGLRLEDLGWKPPQTLDEGLAWM